MRRHGREKESEFSFITSFFMFCRMPTRLRRKKSRSVQFQATHERLRSFLWIKTNEELWKGIFIGKHFCAGPTFVGGREWEGNFVFSSNSLIHQRIFKYKECFRLGNVNFVFYRSLTFNFISSSHCWSCSEGKRSIKCRSSKFLEINFFSRSLAVENKNTNFLFPFSVSLNIRAHFLPSISH